MSLPEDDPADDRVQLDRCVAEVRRLQGLLAAAERRADLAVAACDQARAALERVADERDELRALVERLAGSASPFDGTYPVAGDRTAKFSEKPGGN